MAKEAEEVRLNKFIANAGVCSRREADTLIEAGTVEVNGKVVTELGTKVKPNDTVKVGGETIKTEEKRYLLINKPKDYITTVTDTHNRRTVMDLVKGACKERVYPVGRLDRATTGILLLTNDGEMAKKLTHPRYEVEKLYHVQLNKNVAPNHLHQLTQEGVDLEDGNSKADEAEYVGDGQDKRQIGLLLHSGKNRIVRRMMEALGYRVVRLDRVKFAGLSKKGVPRGKWRFLTESEINLLKMLSA